MSSSLSSTSSSIILRRNNVWRCKPLHLVMADDDTIATTSDNTHNSNQTHRHLGLWDLISIGVGGTVGSGIFVLAGSIAHNYAGPSTCLSFALSGLAALLSGMSFAEWAGRLPNAGGSTYSYAYCALGELPAIIAAACLTLEYGVSGAAVARSWGDKVIEWMQVELQWTTFADWLGGGTTHWNPLAGLISIISVLLLMYGVQESKTVTNICTMLKVGLVVFMMVGGFALWQSPNISPFFPHNTTGTLRGATSSFFAFLGYDEVCCLASEAKHPRQDMPKAVLYTIGIVTILYVLASLALVGMVPYQEISDTSGFPSAFANRGITWAAQVTAAGEVITLPVVVLISYMAQPRLFEALAKDGLLPNIFGQRRWSDGNLLWSHVICGTSMTVIATLVPFSYLDDGISVGILVAFNMTNTSLIVMKCCHEGPHGAAAGDWVVRFALQRHLGLFHIVASGAAMAPRLLLSDNSNIIRFLALLVVGCYIVYIHTHSTKQSSFGSHLDSSNETMQHHPTMTTTTTFETPMVPFVPLLGIALNWYLIAQLEWIGLFMLFGYLGTISILYWWYYGSKDRPNPWMTSAYLTVATPEESYDADNNYRDDGSLPLAQPFRDEEPTVDNPILLREYSLPKR